MHKFAVLLVFLLLPGCFTIVRHDPVTLEQIEKTIAFEEQDFDLSRQGMLDQLDILGLTIRHESELLRLWAWLHYEEAKKTP